MQEDTHVPTQMVEPKTPRKSNLLGIALALLLAVGAFVSGTHAQTIVAHNQQVASIFSFFSAETVAAPESRIDMTEFWKVWDLLDDRFISASSTKVVSDEDKLYGAIAGLVSAYGDPYTVFFPPVQSAAFAEDISGNFSGIGMEVGSREGVITVIAPLVGTPADKAGLMSGDLIVKIDDVSTQDMPIEEAVKRIRGEKGTVVKLTIFRQGEIETKDISVTRDTITIPTVKTEQREKTFIISLYSFNAVSEVKMQEALEEYKRSNATKLVLDLRGNPGGYLQSAVSIASFFLPTGKVVVRERMSEAGEEKLYRSQGRTLGARAPEKMVVLIDSGSASASEILAGALQEHGYATLIGVNSFGKGSVQELVDIPDGSSLKVTVARWFTPNGVSISLNGLSPDITIGRTPQQRIDQVDPQLDAALRFLDGKTVESETKKDSE